MKLLRNWVKIILLFLNKCIKKKEYISFCSIPDFSDNPQALFDYIYHRYQCSNMKVCWHIMDKKNSKLVNDWLKRDYNEKGMIVKVVPKYSVKSIYYFFRSRVIIDSHGMYEFKTNQQIDLYLFHGMPVKKVGYLLHTNLVPQKLIGFHYSVSSPLFKNIFMKAFYAEDNDISISGMPRNDYLYKPISSYQGISRYIVFMPTFRKTNGKYNFHMEDAKNTNNTLFNINQKDWSKIDLILKSRNIHMFIKPHPSDELHNVQYLSNCENIRLIDDKELLEQRIPLYRFLGGSMGLITDYSSTYIDYLLTNKPICFFIPDLEEYKNNRGFVFDDFNEMLVGPVCRNTEDLCDYLKSDFPICDNYKRVKDLTNSIIGPISSSLIMKEFEQDIFLGRR